MDSITSPQGFIDGCFDALRDCRQISALFPHLPRAVGAVVDSKEYVRCWQQGVFETKAMLQKLTFIEEKSQERSLTPIMTAFTDARLLGGYAHVESVPTDEEAEPEKERLLMSGHISWCKHQVPRSFVLTDEAPVEEERMQEPPPKPVIFRRPVIRTRDSQPSKEKWPAKKEDEVSFVEVKVGDGWCAAGVNARNLLTESGYSDSVCTVVGSDRFSNAEKKKKVHTVVMYNDEKEAVAATVFREIPQHNAIELAYLVVSQTHRRRRYGTRLVEEVVRRGLELSANVMCVDVECKPSAEAFWLQGIGCTLLQDEALVSEMVDFGDDVRCFAMSLGSPFAPGWLARGLLYK